MADFKSSDIEFSEPEDQNPRIGRKAMASMTKHSKLDRIASKRTLKTLEYVGNAPSTTIVRRYWYDLFKHFATTTLQLNSRPDKTPTADDVVRFIARLPSHLVSKHSDGKIGWTVIENAVMQLDGALTFHYSQYKLSRHDRLRINATMQTLLDNGEVTRDPVREKQWLTCQIVKNLVTAVLVDSVENGTKSWDATLAGSFALVLQAALCSRAGDFKKSAHYSGEEYLKWRDIELVATVDNGKMTLQMLVKLLWRKGCKRDHSKAMSVELHQLDDSYSVVDPTKLCVAHALRIGLVKETNWSDLINAVLSRPSKRFIWTNPDSPVFHALTRGQHLDFARSATVDQQRRFLCHAAQLLGMLKIPVTHDLRRGAAADIFALNSNGGDTNRVRRALGHSMGAMNKGVTDEYIGRTKGDDWSARLNSTVADDPWGVQIAPASFNKRKLMPAEIDKYCVSNGLNTSDRNDRYKARNSLAQAQHDQWSTQQQNIADAEQTQLPSSKVSAAQKGVPNDQLMGDADEDLDLEDTDASLHGLNLENMDDGLRDLADNMLGAQTDTTSNDRDGKDVDSMTNGCIALWEKSQDSDEHAVLTAAPEQFIGYLSTINLVCVSSEFMPNAVATGNSRDPPTRFLFHCKNERCSRTFYSSLRRDQHQVNCVTTPPSLLFDTVDSDDPMTLPATTITDVKSKRKRKPQDINKASEGFPKPCPDNEICGVTKTFATDHLLRKHRLLHHDEKWPEDTACNFPGCQLFKDHYFVSRQALKRHLTAYHMLNAAEARDYIGKIIPVAFQAPRGISKSYVTTMCLFPSCKTEAEFANYGDYTGHLKKTHSLTPDQYPLYMPIPATVRLHPRTQAQDIDITTPVDRVFVGGDPCSHADCSTSTATYTTKKKLDDHLGQVHQLAASERPKYHTGVEIAPFYGTKCLHSACACNQRFYSTLPKYKQHLKSVHKVSTVAEISSFQLWWKLKYGQGSEHGDTD